jgi:hypothetical protein
MDSMIGRNVLVATGAVAMVTPVLAQAIDVASGGSAGREVPQRVQFVASATGERDSGEAKVRGEAVLVAARSRKRAGVPTLDVSLTCHAVTSLHLSDGQDYDNCMQDERQARDQLLKNWSSYSSAIHARCAAEATTGGTPSYVDLVECMEMTKTASPIEANGSGSEMTSSRQATGAIKKEGSEPPKGTRTEQSTRSAAPTIHIPSENDLDRAREIDPKVLQGVCRDC